MSGPCTSRDCGVVRDLLALFASRDLTRDEDGSAREHLAACPACRRELRGWLDLRAAFRAETGPERAPTGRPTPDAAFFAALERDVLRAVEVDALRRRSRLAPRLLAAGVLFAAGLGVAFLLVRDRDRPRLLDLDRLEGSSPFLVDPGAWTRPVGQHSWVGLRGRISADDYVFRLLDGDAPPRTAPVPLRSEEPADGRDGDAPDVPRERR